MKFILTSNASSANHSWATKLGVNPDKLTAAFIDTAADVYNKAEADWLKADRNSLTDLGLNVTDYSLVGKTKSQLIDDLAKFDVLFVSGGNTFYLLEHANKSGFTQLIKEDYFNDKIYIGSSAGSVLLSNNIEVIKFLDDPQKANLDNYNGVGIFNFTILPHWGSDKFKEKYLKAIDYAYLNSIQAFALPDNQYILSENNSFKLVTD
jgi:dipeptidase E